MVTMGLLPFSVATLMVKLSALAGGLGPAILSAHGLSASAMASAIVGVSSPGHWLEVFRVTPVRLAISSTKTAEATASAAGSLPGLLTTTARDRSIVVGDCPGKAASKQKARESMGGYLGLTYLRRFLRQPASSATACPVWSTGEVKRYSQTFS